MSEVKISALLSMLLLTVLASTVVASTEAQVTESSTIKFKASAVGECFMGYGDPWPIMPYPRVWSGIGRGIARISGRAEAVPFDHDFIENAYIPESLNARSSISLSWTEEDGSKHRLQAVLYSTASAVGVFFPDDDYFNVAGRPVGEMPVEGLMFRGEHTSGSEIQRISGVALFLCTWFGFSPDHYSSSIHLNEVILLDEDTETMYAAIWTSEETLMPPLTPLLVPAAKVFQRNVEVISSP